MRIENVKTISIKNQIKEKEEAFLRGCIKRKVRKKYEEKSEKIKIL